jgi:hypothetical protein
VPLLTSALIFATALVGVFAYAKTEKDDVTPIEAAEAVKALQQEARDPRDRLGGRAAL